MSYKKTEPKANFSEIEHSVLDFWREDDTFHKSLNKTKMGEPFNFYDVKKTFDFSTLVITMHYEPF